MSPRETYLKLALLVAEHGLPAPMSQRIRTDKRSAASIQVEFAALQDAALWAQHFQLKPDDPYRAEAQGRVLYEWAGRGLGDLYITVECWLTERAPACSPLAARVVAAILSPDDPSLPVEVAVG